MKNLIKDDLKYIIKKGAYNEGTRLIIKSYFRLSDSSRPYMRLRKTRIRNFGIVMARLKGQPYSKIGIKKGLSRSRVEWICFIVGLHMHDHFTKVRTGACK